MRTDKELLELVLEHSGMIKSGICICLFNMLVADIICYGEYSRLYEFIHKHRPKPNEKFYCDKYGEYFWKRGDKKIRVKWLKYQIEQL